MTTLTQVASPVVEPSFEEQEEELAKAETAMWSWYLEWSKIARVAIKQRSLLRELGFLTSRRGEVVEDDETEPTTSAGTNAMAPAPAASAAGPQSSTLVVS